MDVEPSPNTHLISGLPVTVIIGENDEPVVINVIFASGVGGSFFIS
ncbi:hypothetical protein MTHERMMSTA1_25430 [Methanosarcina thermophila MST-A1]|nr:hypothetical protein MTHERMMSTA1_25430 [Methanosarcina thermophila MST-A1]